MNEQTIYMGNRINAIAMALDEPDTLEKLEENPVRASQLFVLFDELKAYAMRGMLTCALNMDSTDIADKTCDKLDEVADLLESIGVKV